MNSLTFYGVAVRVVGSFQWLQGNSTVWQNNQHL